MTASDAMLFTSGMSDRSAVKLRLGLEELATVREQFGALLSLSVGENPGVI